MAAATRAEVVSTIVSEDAVRPNAGKKKSAYASHLTGIQNRTEPKDIFYTPHDIATKMVEMAGIRVGDRVLEPCRGDGAVYDLLPSYSNNLWCEIAMGRDFYEFNDKVDVVITNPPFSHYSPFLNHILELNPRTIVLLGDAGKPTRNRMVLMMQNGYTLTKQHICYWSVCLPSSICFLLCFERLEHDDEVNIIATWDYRLHGPLKTQKYERNTNKFRNIIRDTFLTQNTDDDDEVDELADQLQEVVDLSADDKTSPSQEQKVFVEDDKTSLSEKPNGFVENDKSSLSKKKPYNIFENGEQLHPSAQQTSDQVGLSRPAQQRSLSDEARKMLFDVL
jgi:hypothetical protein